MTGDGSQVDPARLALQIHTSLKTLVVLLGQSLRAQSRIEAMLSRIRAKHINGGEGWSQEEVAFMQHHHRHGAGTTGATGGGRGSNSMIATKAIQAERQRYDSLIKELADWIVLAKEALREQLDKTTKQEEAERLAEQERVLESNRLAEEAKALESKRRAEEESTLASNAEGAGEMGKEDEAMKTEDTNGLEVIVLDDDDDEDDAMPLAQKSQQDKATPQTLAPPADQAAIDLTTTTNSTATGDQKDSTQQVNVDAISSMIDPTALLASLTSGGTTSDQAPAISNLDSLALDNFDFSQLNLPQMDGATTSSGFDAANLATTTDSMDAFNMDFFVFTGNDDQNNGNGPGGMIDSSGLFDNIDFSSILGGMGNASNADAK